jgi:osmotically-inducible protein OsmY
MQSSFEESVCLKIKREILQHHHLKDLKIEVRDQGVDIILTGEVTHLYEKWLAEEIASHSVGVTHVRNYIHIAKVIRDNPVDDYYEL